MFRFKPIKNPHGWGWRIAELISESGAYIFWPSLYPSETLAQYAIWQWLSGINKVR